MLSPVQVIKCLSNLVKFGSNKFQPVIPGHTEAILRYEHSSVGDPSSSKTNCTVNNRCSTLNAPYE